MRPTKPKWHTKALRIADHNICAEFTRRSEENKRKEISRNDHEGILGVKVCNDGVVVRNCASDIRILEQCTKDL